MARKGESIFKRKDGEAIYGYVYERTYSECEKRKNMLLNKTKADKPKTIKRTKNGKTLNNLVDKWLKNKDNIKQYSYTRYFNLINQHIKNDVGKV